MATFSVDLETTSLDPHKGSIICASWCGTDLHPHAEPWNEKTKLFITMILGDPKNTIITQNGVFDYGWLVKEGITVRARIEDTMVGSHVIESHRYAGLHHLVARYLIQEILEEAGIKIKIDYQWKKEGPEEWMRTNKKWYRANVGRDPHMGDVPLKLLYSYAKKDALYTLLVWFAMRDYLKGDNKFSYRLDISMIAIVTGMKARGIPIDTALCRSELVILRKRQRVFLKKYDIEKCGPNAKRDIIFPALKIKLKYKTEKGNWQFNERSMRRYQVAHPDRASDLEEVIQFGKAKQSDSTYYSGYMRAVWCGRIFPNFNITNAKTGRFSSSNPNLQNVKKGGRERSVFLVRPGFINLHWDYDQIELRLLAHYSQERRLIKVFAEHGDPHTLAATLMGITERSAKKYLIGKYRGKPPRFIGKQLNYAFWYGMGVETFALDLGIPMKKGQELFERYRGAYPDAVTWSKSLISTAKQVGYVQDDFGRKYYPDDRWSHYKLVNNLIQGHAGQAMKIGMLRAQHALYRDKGKVEHVRAINYGDTYGQQLLTIHDEIGAEFPDRKKRVSWALKTITRVLTFDTEFSLPLTVGAKWTRTNWQDLKEISKVPIPW